MITVADLNVKTICGKELLQTISFHLSPGEMIVVTGTSGSGKTTLLNVLMSIKSYHISCDYLSIDGHQLFELTDKKKRELYGTTIGFIPQNPITAFHPLQTVGTQMCQTIQIKMNCSKKQAKKMATQALDEVNLNHTEKIFEALPTELSGGMLQRIAIAICFALQPRYIFADEPTVFLDEKNKTVVIDLLKKLQKKSGILLVTHELKPLSFQDASMLIIENGMNIFCGDFKEGYDVYLMKRNIQAMKQNSNIQILDTQFIWSSNNKNFNNAED